MKLEMTNVFTLRSRKLMGRRYFEDLSADGDNNFETEVNQGVCVCGLGSLAQNKSQ